MVIAIIIIILSLSTITILLTLLGILTNGKSWCFLSLHRWDMPGGHCIDCGKHDNLFDEYGN